MALILPPGPFLRLGSVSAAPPPRFWNIPGRVKLRSGNFNIRPGTRAPARASAEALLRSALPHRTCRHSNTLTLTPQHHLARSACSPACFTQRPRRRRRRRRCSSCDLPRPSRHSRGGEASPRDLHAGAKHSPRRADTSIIEERRSAAPSGLRVQGAIGAARACRSGRGCRSRGRGRGTGR